MELDYDYKPTLKRSKTIFSILASSNRVDILKILNSKGALTYSELKLYAGFKSKKESGKFAYHLRKLARQSLIALNKSEKRYVITNLGKVVLNMVKQLEERSIVESGKLYFRTIDKYHEFNANRLAQILIRNADMPPEASNKIAEEVESKILKLEISYLTHSMVMDIMNATLIEHGYEEYRERLERIGISTFELQRLLTQHYNKLEDIIIDITNNIFAEYTLFYYLPKDVVDQHIEGNIHISTTNLSSITPDTLFVDLSTNKFDDIYTLIRFIQQISKEVSREVVLNDINLKGLDSKNVANLFALLSSPTLISLRVEKDLDIILQGYKLYLENVLVPNIGLIIEPNKIDNEQLIDILQLGGLIAISKEERSMLGIKKSMPIDIVIHSVSINLPRLAYESNKDEMFFRAKLANMLQSALDALILKKKIVSMLIDNKVLWMLNNMKDGNNIRMILNLIDPYTAIHNILECNDVFTIMNKTIETAKNVIGKMNNHIGLAIISDEGASRLASLDLERYGKFMNVNDYMKNIIIDMNLLDGYNSINKTLDGLSLVLDLDSYEHIIDKVYNLHFVPRLKVYVCNTCKRKGRNVICKSCNKPTTMLNLLH